MASVNNQSRLEHQIDINRIDVPDIAMDRAKNASPAESGSGSNKVCEIALRVLFGALCGGGIASLIPVMASLSSPEAVYPATVIPGAVLAAVTGGCVEKVIWETYASARNDNVRGRIKEEPEPPLHPFIALCVYAVSGAVAGVCFGANATRGP